MQAPAVEHRLRQEAPTLQRQVAKSQAKLPAVNVARLFGGFVRFHRLRPVEPADGVLQPFLQKAICLQRVAAVVLDHFDETEIDIPGLRQAFQDARTSDAARRARF